MKIRNIQVTCPYCGKMNKMPEAAGVLVTCSWCGKNWHTEGIEVMDRAGSKIYDDFDRQRKKEIEADKEKD